jgi:putative transposase
MKKYATEYSIKMMARVLLVSPSGYYSWFSRAPSKRAEENKKLLFEIKKVFDSEKGRAGAPRITKKLSSAGCTAGPHRIAKIMRDQGLRAKAGKKYKATTNSNHRLPVAPNLLLQNFEAIHPNEKWVSDITYIWTDEGWLYLAVVLDLYSRMVVGWAISERMTTALVSNALTMALWRRKFPKNVILHSDRGSQYCAHEYQKLIKKHQLICSMSKKGDCYDNAAMESWNHSLKVEAIHGERFKTRADAKLHIFDYIDVDYNRQRLHSKLGYLSPIVFEEQKVA